MLAVEELDFKSFISQKDYYAGSIPNMHSSHFGNRGVDFSAGMRVYDISDPANPRAIGFMEVEGLGIHRIFWVGGRYAYASAILDGYTDHILIIIDLQIRRGRSKLAAGGCRACGSPAARRKKRRAASPFTTPSSLMTSPTAPGATAASRSST